MEEKSKTFEIQREFVKSEVDRKRFILIFNDGETNKWQFHAVEATNYSEEQLTIILDKLKELNKSTV